jgi:hypothetical protein
VTALTAIDPEAILRGLLGLDPGLRLERYWGERSIFYNPGRVEPLGVIVASVKDHDGANDRSAELSRTGVYRPHPVYAWMRWVQILALTAAQFASLRPLLAESLALAQARWRRRTVA